MRTLVLEVPDADTLLLTVVVEDVVADLEGWDCAVALREGWDGVEADIEGWDCTVALREGEDAEVPRPVVETVVLADDSWASRTLRALAVDVVAEREVAISAFLTTKARSGCWTP